MAQGADAPEAIVEREVREVCYCGLCGRRMQRFKTEPDVEGGDRIVHWRCPSCMGRARQGRTVESRVSEISRRYRRR